MSVPIERKGICKPVVIGDNVWIGESACILPGVTIGEGSIIGALSVVTKSIPAYSIAVGSPAKVVKIYNFKQEKWIKT
jgi:lipopolysaccharide O-acetyltransferase